MSLLLDQLQRKGLGDRAQGIIGQASDALSLGAGQVVPTQVMPMPAPTPEPSPTFELARGAAADQMIRQAIDNPELRKDPSFIERGKRFFGNKENALRLAMAFNTLRNNPDSGLQSYLATELKASSDRKTLQQQIAGLEGFLMQNGVDAKQVEQLRQNPVLMREMAKKIAAQKFGVAPADQQAFESLISGFSEEDQLRARRIKAGLDPRAGSTLNLSPEDLALRAFYTKGGTLSAEQFSDAEKLMRSNQTALRMFDYGMDNLEQTLLGTSTGFVQGLLPAITGNQQLADNAVSQMAPILKSLFRQAGEGVFTDKDQELLMGMLPSRGTSPAVIGQSIKMIRELVRLKLSTNQDVSSLASTFGITIPEGNGGGNGGEPAPAPAPVPVVDPNNPLNLKEPKGKQ